MYTAESRAAPATLPCDRGAEPRDAAGALAVRMAAQKGQLHTQLAAFRKTLIPNLKPKAFTDMYARTIAYGLFAARTTTESPDTFSRKTAGWDLPRTNPFWRNLFNEIAGPALDERVAWIVDNRAGGGVGSGSEVTRCSISGSRTARGVHFPPLACVATSASSSPTPRPGASCAR